MQIFVFPSQDASEVAFDVTQKGGGGDKEKKGGKIETDGGKPTTEKKPSISKDPFAFAMPPGMPPQLGAATGV